MEVVAMPEATHDQVWGVADAKARFSELLDQAINNGPQIIARRGRQIVVVVAIEEWSRKSMRSGSLAAFLATSPLRDSQLDVERVDVTPRNAGL